MQQANAAMAFGQVTRHHGVDTTWIPKIGVRAAKDYLIVEQYCKYET